jgi:O-antigen ligase
VTRSEAPSSAAEGRPDRPVAVRYAERLVLPLAAAALTLWLSFHSGGFFAGTTGVAALAAGVALLVWLMVVARPLDRLSVPLAILLAALGAFALWTLASGSWSHSPSRALVEFDRALLYVLAAALAGIGLSQAAVRRNLLRTITGALVVVCACGLLTRLLPHFWPVTPTVQPDRLGYPVSYWNTLGMIAALATVACLHLAAEHRERLAIRALAAAAVPIVVTTLFFTFSRGAIAVLPIGLVVYLVLGRPHGLPSALLAIVPTAAVAAVWSYRANAVVNEVAPTRLAVTQGRTLAVVVAACAVAAAAILVAARPLDARVERRRRRSRINGRLVVTGAGAAVLAAIVIALAAGAPQRLVHQFVEGNQVTDSGDRRARLTDLGNNGRVDHWRVALHGFSLHPLDGSGAGTYALLWQRYRHLDFDVNDGHSLYLEVLGEMGIVGGALIVLAVGTLLVGGALRIRGPDRTAAAVTFALVLMWALRAGIDWDWEMPALTLPVLVIGAAGLGRARLGRSAVGGADKDVASADRLDPPWPGRVPRLLAGIALLAILITPLNIVRSQSHLDTAVADARTQRCGPAIDAALKSIDAVDSRPEPFEVLGLCDARLGRGDLAVAAMNAAVRRDPNFWKLRYELAVVRASQGRDPRPELRRARRLNPMSTLVRDALERFDTSKPAVWRHRSLRTPFPL